MWTFKDKKKMYDNSNKNDEDHEKLRYTSLGSYINTLQFNTTKLTGFNH